MSGSTPVAQGSRIAAIDVLRGFALLGILGANITLFDVDGIGAVEQSFDDLVVGAAGAPFMAFLLVFVLNKMMAVFSMLFGAGVLLVTERIEARGGSALRVHYVRNLLLLLIGLAHSALWFGDILLVYGTCAMVLYPLRRLPARALLGGGAAVWLLAFVVESGAEEEYVVRALAMMLVGMGLYRSRIIDAGRGAGGRCRGRSPWACRCARRPGCSPTDRTVPAATSWPPTSTTWASRSWRSATCAW